MLSKTGATTRYTSNGEAFTLATDSGSATWSVAGAGLRLQRVVAGTNSLNSGPAAFTLALNDGTSLSSAEFRIMGSPSHQVLPANPGASRLAERLPGGR